MTDQDPAGFARRELGQLAEAVGRLNHDGHVATMVSIAEAMAGVLRAGGRILACGNGGSATQAQHLVAELVGRLHFDRPALAAIALTADVAVLTAVSNDYGYEAVFARQVAAFGR